MTGGERYLVEMPSQSQRGKMEQTAVFPYQIRASRPGAKSSFGRAEDVYRLLETTPSSYNNAKKLDALATEAMRLADITPAGKDVSLHELAEMVGQDLEGDRSRASRPGAKAEFTNIFGHDLAEETIALYEERLVSYRKALANADLLVKKANSLLRRDDQQSSQEVVGIARIMESAMKSPRGFSRPGAKTEFAIDARDELMMRTWIKNNYPKADNAAFNKMLAKMTKEYAKDPKGYTYGGGFRAVAKAAGFSRAAAKTRMTREQTEEQKAGLKIMSAADPAVGEKIATLIKEGKPQDQAVAIALDMKRRGEL